MSISICSSLFVYGENSFDRIAAHIAQSTIINSINKACARLRTLSGKPAPKELQELGLQAQQEVGVDIDRRVPIRTLAIDKNECVAAIADTHQICVNSDMFYSFSVAERRCAMFHEAVHIKYNDYLCQPLFNVACYITAVCVGRSLQRIIKADNAVVPVVPIVSFLLSIKLGSYYHRYQERRADRQGMLATKCHVCVNECSDIRKNYVESNSYSLKKIIEILKKANDGVIKLTKEQEKACNIDKDYHLNWMNKMNNYLLPQEIKDIAKRLEQQKLVCPEHQPQPVIL